MYDDSAVYNYFYISISLHLSISLYVISSTCSTSPAHTLLLSPSLLFAGAVAVAAGFYHTCALLTGGGVECWGDNEYGQLGAGDTSERNTATGVTDLGSGAPSTATHNFMIRHTII